MSDTWRSVVEEPDTDPETVSDNLFTRSINVIRNNLFGHHFEDSDDVSSDDQSLGENDVASSVDSLLISGLLDLSVSVAEGARSNEDTDLDDMVEGKAWVLYPAYEEKNGSMKNYVRKLELIMECDGVKSASTKMNILKSKLSDETLDELYQLVDGEQVSTYDALKEWLYNRFSDDLSVSNAMIKLRGFHTRVDESHLSKDLTEVAELVMKSSTSKNQSDIVNRTKERFMDKIGDDELFKRLLSKDYSSVSEMINDLCTVFMLSNKRRNDSQKKLKDRRITPNDSGNRPVKFNGTCHSCGIRGHKAVDCRKKRLDNDKSSDKSQQSKINSNIEIIKHNTLPLIKCHVKSSQAIALVDTGANIGLIRQSLVLRQDLPIKTSTVKIRQTFGSKAETLGYVDIPITINGVTKQVRLEVIADKDTDQGYDILLHTKAIKDFQLIIDLANNSMKAGDTDLDMCYVENESDSVNTLQFNHSVIAKESALERIFEKNPEAKNAIVGDGNVVPCSQFEAPVQHFTTDVPHRFIKYTVPFNLKHIVDNEIDKLIEMGIIIPMETPYLHNLILVRKSNDEHRPYLDMRPTNAVAVVDSYPVGNMHEILSDLYGNTLFSSLDIRQAYYQISIPKINQVRFGLYTDRGTYVYTRLPFGYVNSGQIFQRYLDRVLGSSHLRCFARAYYDDIIIKTHSGLDDHLIKVGEVMEALSSRKLSLNIQKCQIAHDSLEFLGQLITPQGIQPAYENKQMIKNLRVERSITGIKRFLGCVGFSNYIIPNYSKVCGPLTSLLSKKNKDGKWTWTSEHDDAVNKLKEILLSDECVVHPQFDKPFFVYVDSSELYHGAVICQEDSSGKLKVVRYWSKKRTHYKKLRSSVYIELQGIVEVVRKFRNYFIGSDVTIFTDNRGLISIIRESTDIHFSQWIYELMNYRLTIKYVPGPKNQLADMLSRSRNVEEEKKPVAPEDEEEKSINIDDPENTYCLNSISINELKDAQEADKNLTDDLIKEYKMIKLNEIWGINVSREMGINSIFVPYLPDCKVKEICRQTHELGHFCINKCRNLLRNRWFNPNIESTLKELIFSCTQCQKRNQHYPGLTKHQFVDYDEPRACYSMDLCGPIGGKSIDRNRYILLMVDCFSRFWMSDCIEDVKFNTVARTCIKLFNMFGRPRKLRTDNATYLTTEFMEDLCKELSIHHSLSTPYEHRGNTHCERGLKTLEAIVCKIRDENKNLPWSSFVQHAVYFYNVSDCESTGYSPYHLFFGTRPTLSMELADEVTPGLVDKNSQIAEIKYQTRLAYNCAYSTLLTRRLKANGKYNSRVKEKQPMFKAGDKILVKKPLSTGKLDYYYAGPFEVSNADNFIVYYKKPRFKKEFRAHCCMVKLYHEPKDSGDDAISQGGVSEE